MLLKKMVIPVATGLLVASAVVWAVEEQYDENRERDMTERAPVDLAKAIDVAERATGGVALEAGAEVEHGRSYYEVTAHTGTADDRIRVSASTGKVMNTKRLSAAGHEHQRAGRLPSGAERSMLADAVRRAETRIGGKAMEAELDRKDGKLVYRIELAQGKEIRKITVDGRDRTVSSAGAMSHKHGAGENDAGVDVD